MSNWAEIDENSIVIRVVHCDNFDPAGDLGYTWLVENLGGRWVQTSFSGSFRKNFAGPGFIYSKEYDAFIPPKPDGDGWVLSNKYFMWENPSRGITFDWDEEKRMWKTSESSLPN